MSLRRWLAGGLAFCLWGCPARQPDTTTNIRPSPRVTPRPLTTHAKAEWTLVFYFAADNDLEQAQMHDLTELTRLPDVPGVHLLALVDRSPMGEESEGYSNQAVANLANWSGARLLRIGHDRLEELDDWGKLNMADPASLQRLLGVAQNHFPSQRRALFIVDHGQAWVGVCDDDSATRPGDALNLKELDLALQGLKQPLDLLAFDACMMSSLEVLTAVARHSRYVVASQDSLPSQGLDYFGGLSPLMKNVRADGKQLGRWFLESYRQSLGRDDIELSRLQLSLLSTDRAGELQTQWNQVSKALTLRADRNWQALAQSRAAVASFRVDDPVSNQGMTMHDISQLVTQWRQHFPDLEKPLSKLARSLSETRVDQICGRFHRDCGGLSVFFPAQSAPLKQGELEYTQQLESWLPAWVGFVKSFTETRAGGEATLSEVVLSSQGSGLELSARLGSPTELESSHTILVHDERVIGQIPCLPEGQQGTLHDTFEGKWLTLGESGGKSWLTAQLSRLDSVEEGRRALATLPMLLQRGTEPGPPLDVQLYFGLQGHPSEVKGAFLGADRSTGLGRTRVELKPGDRVAFRELSLVPGGHADAGAWMVLSDPKRLRLEQRAVEPGNYQIGFLLRDLQGRPQWKTRPLLWGE